MSLPIGPKPKQRPTQLPLPSATTSSISVPPRSPPVNATNSPLAPRSPGLSLRSPGRPQSWSDAPGMLTIPNAMNSINSRNFAIPAVSRQPPPKVKNTGAIVGVQPSASFFQPLRPDEYPSRPSSAQSDMTSSRRASSVLDSNLNPNVVPNNHEHIRPSDDEKSEPVEGRNSMSEDAHQLMSANKLTPPRRPVVQSKSTDPLLPAGNGGTSATRERPTIAVDNAPSPTSGGGAWLRERVFGRPPGSPRSPATTSPASPTAHFSSSDAHSPADASTVHGFSSAQPTDEEYPMASIPPYKRQSDLRQPHVVYEDPNTPIFNPTLPSEPLFAVPIAHDGKPVKNYEGYPSYNKWFFGGRFINGGDPKPFAFIFTVAITFAIAGVWFGSTVVWWWKNESVAVAAVGIYMTLLTFSLMFTVAFTDPGIIPRNLDPDPPLLPFDPEEDEEDAEPTPYPRDLTVRFETVRVKYCPTCKTYRPPRSSHCKVCNNCVEHCDHHCQWVNNCVGRRNYSTFFAFLVSGVLTLIIVIVTSALNLHWEATRNHLSVKQAFSHQPGAAVAFCLAAPVSIFAIPLMSYHIKLVLGNYTTIEQLRNQASQKLEPDLPPWPNPFDHGSFWKNLMDVLCRPKGMSYVDFSAQATADRREINPALVKGGGWGKS